MFHAIRERHGVRLRWWLWSHVRSIGIEFYWWSSSCGVRIGVGDDGWHGSAAFPPLAVYLSLEGFPLWKPTRKVVATWDGNREIVLTDRREFSLSVHSWALWFTPWGRFGEWCSRDPWWIRGVSLNLFDVLLGPETCECVKGEPFGCTVPMPEGLYRAKATHERRTWKRPRWFRRVRDSVWLDIEPGIPHAGKGENSWDCGDDALFGIGGDTLVDAIQNARKSVTESRRKYGHASEAAVRAALRTEPVE